ncbi:unnamed protein product [Paramecium sonneborni]|uniref:Protein kinase domain-containing protein n=1 Tax=Paramecium sonneborni TaxID=65129 RepID=A0A8S1LG95_9CILI|nr:unnamed protein product [Paramecium sonneborni]
MIQGEHHIIDNYKILLNCPIGKGQYGCVYDCQMLNNVGQPAELCAKIMLVHDNTQKKYSDGEKRISEIICDNQNNQNLVRIYFVKEIPEQKKLLIIMEKCESNLQQLWEKKTKFNDEEIYDFLDQFLNGYKVLYNKDIMHRDIKPENILIKYINGKTIYKLADFGIGKIYKANDFKFTKIGTPAYAAPEINSSINDDELNQRFLKTKNQFEHSRSQVDVFSLGVILYQLVFGDYPFKKTAQGIVDFVNGLKNKPLKLQGNSQFIGYIENMLKYYPDERLAFHYLITQMESKKQLRQTFTNNTEFLLFQVLKGNQNKSGSQKPFQSFNQNNNTQQQSQFQNQQANNNQQQNPKINTINSGQQQQFNTFQNGTQTFQKEVQNNNFRLTNQSWNTYQKIKEHIEYLMNNQEEILMDNPKFQFRLVINNYNNNNITIQQLQNLLNAYPIKEGKIQKYEFKTLTYFYCLLAAISQQQNIQIVDDTRMREELTKYFNNQNPKK